MGSRGQNSVASHFGSIRPSQIQASIQTFTLSLPFIWSFLNPFPGLTLAVNISLASSFPISLWLSHRTITLSVLCVAVLPYRTCTHTCATVHCNRSSSACSHARRSSPSSPDPVTATVDALALSLGLPLSFPSPSILRPGSDTFCVPLSRSRTAVHTVGSSYLEPRLVS